MLFFRNFSFYKESCSISLLFFFSLLFSPSMLRPRAYYVWRHLAWCFPDFSQPKTLELQLHFLVLLAFKANAHITQCEVTFITYKYFYN